MREPVPLIPDRFTPEAAGEVDGRALDVAARFVGPRPHPLLVAGWNAPAVPAPNERAVDPHVEVRAAAARMHLEAARQGRVRRLVAAMPEDTSPAERVHDQRRGDLAAVGLHGRAASSADGRGLEPRPRLPEQQLAQMPVVKRRPAPREAIADVTAGGVKRHARDLLADRFLHPHRA